MLLIISEYLQQGCHDNGKPVSSSSSKSFTSISHNNDASTTKLETTSKKSAIISPAPNIQSSVDSGRGKSTGNKEQQAVLRHSFDTSDAELLHATREHSFWIIFTFQLTLLLCSVRWR